MNKNHLKSYAPQARKDFIAAVKARANLLGLSEQGDKLQITEATISGNIAIIAGREWPIKVEKQRQALVKKIQSVGFQQTIEAVAYTWFNRFAALRYMELHDYLDHGIRVLSNPKGGLPEVINKFTEITLQGLNLEYAKQLKLAGNKDGELYKLLLVAQCNALSTAMPFLFERIDDETELLLPDNLLLTDSIIAKLVGEIPEADWAQVEIIGWLYQFYISEKKDEVIGKVVKSEDIPAATQLFTPNWIVQYLVQNSIGRLWMMANRQSTVASQWPYYIKPAEQTPEVNANLQTLIDIRIAQDGTTLTPESITVLDPACGSGHILVEAYETLKQIYLERGYQPRAIPRLILEKNLFGLDIDDRAAQLAGFALLMKARADDRRILQEPPKLNVISLQESKDLIADDLAHSLSKFGVNRNSIADLIDTFQNAKTFGSLIQIPAKLQHTLKALNEQCQQALTSGDLFAQEAAQSMLPLITQARLLAKQYDAVIANPPYMGSKSGMNSILKQFVNSYFSDSNKDLFACFIERGYTLAKSTGLNAMVTMHSWMFLSSFEMFRRSLLKERTINTMVHLGPGGFANASAMIVQTTAFVLSNRNLEGYRPVFFRLLEGGEDEKKVAFSNRQNRFDRITQDELGKIPDIPVAYWASENLIRCFGKDKCISDLAFVKQGLATSNNERFLRNWSEVSYFKINRNALDLEDTVGYQKKWYPYNKGGEFRKWFGNHSHVVNWCNNGEELWEFTSTLNQGSNVRLKSREFYFKVGATWTDITAGSVSARLTPPGFIFDASGPSIFDRSNFGIEFYLGLLNSVVTNRFIELMNPTLHFQPRDANNLPVPDIDDTREIKNGVSSIIDSTQKDWDAYERSWDFQSLPLLTAFSEFTPTLASSYTSWITQNRDTIAEMKRLEEENNRIFIDAYGLADELTPDVPIEQITLTVNPAYRYRGQLTEEELRTRFREDSMQELVSYAIGCMMGRYSLDEPGLIYAHAGNEGFDATHYQRFVADADGILPITDTLWFEDDATNRVREFLMAVWGAATLDENLVWLAESLGTKGNETPLETIRRYIAGSFYKDHLQTYKKRPIYWQFSSGKQGAFQALVYLHRYNEGTLARMRSEYVVPLMGKLKARIEMLEKDTNSATSTTTRNKLSKEIEQLNKKQFELQTYDEKLRHHADMRIKLDLDDGVKVNYGKFGDLLSDVKAITGGSDD